MGIGKLKGPLTWELVPTDVTYIYDGEGKKIADDVDEGVVLSQETAQRICVCVNALDGVPDDFVEQVVKNGLARWADNCEAGGLPVPWWAEVES